MADKKTYTKEEIGLILNRASEIQTSKDLYGEQQGLDTDELFDIAKELGIDRESLNEALLNYETPDWDTSYSWRNGTSRIQDTLIINKTISEEDWEDIVLEIRRVTGGIGKTYVSGNTFEWEQRKNDIGYKHISLTPQDDKTRLQMVDSWSTLKFLISLIGVMAGSLIVLIALKEVYSKQIGLIFAPFGGILGYSAGRIYLKYYYEKQKRKFRSIKSSIMKVLNRSDSRSVTIEEKEVYNDTTGDHTSSSSRVKS